MTTTSEQEVQALGDFDMKMLRWLKRQNARLLDALARNHDANASLQSQLAAAQKRETGLREALERIVFEVERDNINGVESVTRTALEAE